jgi:RNA polymerase sigma-70 factor, ECF subfamily
MLNVANVRMGLDQQHDLLAPRGNPPAAAWYHTFRTSHRGRMTERQLIDLAARGDEAAVRELYRLHAPKMHALALRLSADEAEAEDVTQEAWIRAIRALPSYREDARLSTWLHRVTVNAALHVQRSSRRRDRRELAASVPEAVGSGGDGALLRVRLERALRCLPERMRQVLVLHDVEGYTHEEIARLLGVVPGTCKSQLFKARAKMRSLLSPSREVGEREPTETKEERCGT